MAAALMGISLLGALLPPAHAEPVTSIELIETAKERDGKTVTYTGEAVTGALTLGEHAWVNVNDGANAIGVWCAASQAAAITRWGGYKHDGDRIAVTGIFHRACSEHNGDMDIHAGTMTVMAQGRAVPEDIDKGKALLAIALFVGTFLLVVIFKKRF